MLWRNQERVIRQSATGEGWFKLSDQEGTLSRRHLDRGLNEDKGRPAGDGKGAIPGRGNNSAKTFRGKWVQQVWETGLVLYGCSLVSKVESAAELAESTGDGENMQDQVGHGTMLGKPEGFDRGVKWQDICFLKRTPVVEET